MDIEHWVSGRPSDPGDIPARIGLPCLLSVVRGLALLAGLGVLSFILSRRATGFGTADNLAKLWTDMSFLAIAALGTTMLLIAGGIDLSIGAILAVAAGCAVLAARAGAPPAAGVAAAISAGAALGALNGLLRAVTRLHSALVTLATAFGYGWVSVAVLGSARAGDVPASLQRIAEAELLGVGTFVWLAGVLLLVAAGILYGTAVGRWLVAVGRVPRRSRAALIPWFALNGGLVGLVGAFWAAEYGAIPGVWEGFDAQVIAAALLGGASLLGGTGSVLGAALAAGFVGLVYNGVVVLDAYDRFRWQVSIGLIVAAILLDAVARVLWRTGRRGSHTEATEHTEKKEI